MIRKSEPLSLPVAKEMLEKAFKEQPENARLKGSLDHIKKFAKIKPKDAKKLEEELQSLELIKIKQEHIAKIVNILPETAEELRVIFFGEDISLDQNETEKILSTVKKFV